MFKIVRYKQNNNNNNNNNNNKNNNNNNNNNSNDNNNSSNNNNNNNENKIRLNKRASHQLNKSYKQTIEVSIGAKNDEEPQDKKKRKK